jgi:hypothetical protein
MYLHWRDFGAPLEGGWLEWPPQLVNTLSVAGKVYRAMKGYHEAENKAEWCNRNPAGWGIVSAALALRIERDTKPKRTRFETWLSWQTGKSSTS